MIEEKKLDAVTSRLLVRFGLTEGAPYSPVIPEVATSISVGRVPELPGHVGVEVRDNAMHITFSSSRRRRFGHDDFNCSLRIEFADGSILETAHAYLVGGSSHEVTYLLDDWEFSRGLASSFLFGVLRGAETLPGNLRVVSIKDNSVQAAKWGFRFVGACSWFLVPWGMSIYRVILEGTPSLEDIRRDLTAMEFVFSTGLSLDEVWPLDENGRFVGRIGVFFRRRPRGRGMRSVPPVSPLTYGALMPHLFEMVARALAADRFYALAIGVLMDEISDDLDSHYLKLGVAFEALARKILKTPAPDLVIDRVTWKQWLNRNAAEIEGMASSSGAAKIILSRLHNAPEPSSMDLIKSAATQVGLDTGDQIWEQLRGRNRSAHEFFMADEHIGADQIARRDELRILFASFFLRAIGYRGPLAGYHAADGGARNVDWAGPSELPAELRFLAEEVIARE